MTHACCPQHLLLCLLTSKAVIQSSLWGSRRKTGAHCSVQASGLVSPPQIFLCVVERIHSIWLTNKTIKPCCSCFKKKVLQCPRAPGEALGEAGKASLWKEAPCSECELMSTNPSRLPHCFCFLIWGPVPTAGNKWYGLVQASPGEARQCGHSSPKAKVSLWNMYKEGIDASSS